MHFTVAAIGENHSNYKFGLGFVLNTKKLYHKDKRNHSTWAKTSVVQ